MKREPKETVFRETAVGKGFTKIVKREWSTDDNSSEAFIAAFREITKSENGPRTFGDLRERQLAVARNILREAGLPDRRTVYYLAPNAAKWTCDKPDSTEYGGGSIRHFVIERMGYAHDSNEGFAARLVEAAFQSESDDREQAMQGAFEMGRVSAEARSYAAQPRFGSMRIKPNNSAKDLAVDEIKLLIQKDRNLTAQKAWNDLKTMAEERSLSGENAAIEFQVVGGKERLVFDTREHTWPCARSSFDKTFAIAKKGFLGS